ncbi:MAG: substrate-binding domain-containing protein [Phycisphaeraceae bacterium JB051]
MSEPVQRVMVMVTPSSFGRRILNGVSTYVRPTRSWVMQISINTEPGHLQQLRRWEPTGIIAHMGSEQVVSDFKQWGVPLVNVSNAVRGNDPPHVGEDDHAVGVMAAEHLLEKGLEHFAFCGDLSRGYACDRRDGFRQTVTALGFDCDEFALLPNAAQMAYLSGNYLSSDSERALLDWLAQLPKPTGILVYQDYMGFILCELCRQAGIRIPEELAIIGVDDDETACDFAYPPISSVRSPLEMVGYEAARVLDQLMRGTSAPEHPILLQPSAVTVRQSTDITVCADPDLALALRYIRSHADQPIQVDDLLNEVLISRRSLESKFKQHLNRTPLSEIHRVHVEQAKRLLTETQLPIPRVAESSGFTNAAQMNTVFRKYVGTTPSDYRKRPNRA